MGGLLQDSGHDVQFVSEPLDESNVVDAEVLSVFVSSTVSKAVLDKMPSLKLIACRSTGYNNIDFATTTVRGIAVVNVPTYGEHTVAEYAFTLILALSRKLLPTHKAVLEAQIEPPKLQGFDLVDKTFGIIGAGRIGQTAARIAKGFGMQVLASDPFPNQAKADEIGFELADLERVLRESDIVSLHAPYTPENHHLITAERLALMKPTALLINTARGELVDTKALLEAVQAKRLAGVGLDVMEGEKLLDVDEEILLLRREQIPADQLTFSVELNILEKLPNVVLTPHNAFNTVEAIQRINQTTVDNITGFLAGKTINAVTPPEKPHGRLIITRHGESEWNALGKWTGTRDVHLSEKGFHEAAQLGQIMNDQPLDFAYSSQQIRAFETLESILDTIQQFDVPYERSAALNERDYGDYTGKNKWEMRDLIGQEEFDKLRRNWDHPVPGGETLKMVYERAVPFYEQTILPRLKNGERVLVVSHGNAIRALTKFIEGISDADIAHMEMPFGKIVIYDIDTQGKVVNKSERHIATKAPPA
jgi:D-lactate dehydrogenase